MLCTMGAMHAIFLILLPLPGFSCAVIRKSGSVSGKLLTPEIMQVPLTKAQFYSFLDLKAAYDSIQRPLLWRALSKLGVHGRMLAALQGLYKDATVSVKVSNTSGKTVESTTGFKQGCPLSSTLFGLFLDGLDRYLRVKCSNLGPSTHDGNHVPLLMYADDVALMASSASDLQALISATCDFCTAVGLTVNPAKSCTMQCTKSSGPAPQFVCDDTLIPHLTSVKYLGVTVSSTCGISSTCKSRRLQMNRAWVILQRQYAGLRCSLSLSLMLHLYLTCVQPSGCYACELWGSLPMNAENKRQRQAIATDHMQRLRKMAGLRHSTSAAIVNAELQTSPLEHIWLERQLTFWNNITLLPPYNLFRIILMDNSRDAQVHKIHNWVWSFHRSLERIGYSVVHSYTSLQLKDQLCLQAILKDHSCQPFHEIDFCPRSCASTGASVCTYFNWFSKPKWPCSSFLTAPVHISLMRLFIQFRTGCHNLPIVTGRMQSIPRQERICHACNSSAVCDEKHMIFECPALHILRDKYAHLFSGNITTMKQFMWQENIPQVMLFVRDCLNTILA